jgi:hypothetical protein
MNRLDVKLHSATHIEERHISMTVMNQTLQGVVFQTIRKKPLRPIELIRKLSGEAYARELENALSDLIEDGSIVYGSDGMLRASEQTAHAS